METEKDRMGGHHERHHRELEQHFLFWLVSGGCPQDGTCSLVRFSGQDLIVDTDDLAPVQRIQPGLTRPLSPERPAPEPVHYLHARVDNAVTPRL